MTEDEYGRPLAKCPKCGGEIDHLHVYSLEENKQTISLDEKGSLDWGESEPVECSCVRIDIECHVCGVIIYRNDGNSNDPKFKELLTAHI